MRRRRRSNDWQIAMISSRWLRGPVNKAAVPSARAGVARAGRTRSTGDQADAGRGKPRQPAAAAAERRSSRGGGSGSRGARSGQSYRGDARVLAESQALERSEEEAHEAAERAAREAEDRQPAKPAEQRAREAAEQAAAEEGIAAPPGRRSRSETTPRWPQPDEPAYRPRSKSLIGKKTCRSSGRRSLAARRAMRSQTCRRSRREKSTKTSCRRLKAAQAALTPKVQDLREVSEWQRWANVGIQEQLCEKMEALRSRSRSRSHRATDLTTSSSSGDWRQMFHVRRARHCGAGSRRRTTSCGRAAKAHFAAQAERAGREPDEEVRALRSRVEALADSSNWVQTAEEIKGLQAQWKPSVLLHARSGKAPSGNGSAPACDRFFTRRQEDLVKRKAMWAENFGRKEALCLKVEALAESTDWEPTASAIRALQAEWKTIGPVKKSRSDAIWQRFRAASATSSSRATRNGDDVRAPSESPRERRSASSSKRW